MFPDMRLISAGAFVTSPETLTMNDMIGTIEDNLDLGIIVTLTDGSKIGGRYVDPGFVSSAPADEQLHVGEAWKIDKEILGEKQSETENVDPNFPRNSSGKVDW